MKKTFEQLTKEQQDSANRMFRHSGPTTPEHVFSVGENGLIATREYNPERARQLRSPDTFFCQFPLGSDPTIFVTDCAFRDGELKDALHYVSMIVGQSCVTTGRVMWQEQGVIHTITMTHGEQRIG